MDMRIAAGAGFAVVLVVQAVAIADSWGGDYWVFGCVVGAVVSALTLVRRRVWVVGAGLVVAVAAIVVAGVAGLPGEPGPATALGLAVLVASATRTLPVRGAAVVVVGGFAVVAGTWFVAFDFSNVTTLNAFSWLAGVGAGLYLRLLDARRRAEAENVRRDERLALARELHDVVAHHVTGIVLHAQAARVVQRRHPEKLAESLAGIETASSDALVAMRQVVGLLRDTADAAPASSGTEGLSDLVGRFDGPPVRLRLPAGEPAWPKEVTSTVYRIVQESLTNVARHAPRARSVTVDVGQDQRGVTVEVTDDGPAASRRRAGYGLVGMRERVEALGGTWSAGHRPGGGWTVRATLPLREPR